VRPAEKLAEKAPRVYLPPISALTVAAGAGFVVFGVGLAVGLAVVLHWIAGLVVLVIVSAVAWTAAESHAASVRVPADVSRQGAGFRDPEDQDAEPEPRRADWAQGPTEAFDDGGRW